MRKCPFCDAVIDPDSVDLHYNELLAEWILTHFCGREESDITVSVAIYGKTKQEVIDRWNGCVPHE